MAKPVRSHTLPAASARQVRSRDGYPTRQWPGPDRAQAHRYPDSITNIEWNWCQRSTYLLSARIHRATMTADAGWMPT